MTTIELPPLEQINDWMREAGWQNSAIRQADLSNVARVIRLAIEQDRARPVPGEDELMRLHDEAVIAGINIDSPVYASRKEALLERVAARDALRAAIRQALRQPPSIDQADRERARVAIADLESLNAPNTEPVLSTHTSAGSSKSYVGVGTHSCRTGISSSALTKAGAMQAVSIASRNPRRVVISIGRCQYCGVIGGHDADCEVFYTSIRTTELDRLRAQVAEERELLQEARDVLFCSEVSIEQTRILNRIDAALAAPNQKND